uniref:Uncharacterized protein n=1 Tax=Avena sativa TaxID=4498 RepID=A0ACD5ZSW6_AVESA
MPSTLKRPSLGRLLTSLRPSRGGASPSSFPVQTGFPTSLADIVVKNHGRLRKPRKPRVLASAPTSPHVALAVEAHNEITPPPPPPPAEPLSPAVVPRPDSAPQREGTAVFRLRPEVLAFGGAVALALLAVWSEGTVAAFTVAALSLLWIESASRRRGPRCPAEAEALLDSRGRGPVSPIRAVAVEAPRSSDSCSDSDKGDELVASGGGGSEDPTTPRLKAKRSLKKLISKKLQKKSKSKDSCDGEANQPGTAAGDTADPATLKTESLVPFSTEQTPSESSMEWSSSSSSESVEEGRGGVKFPLAALAPVILAGLVVGKLPATALAVLCIVFSSAVQRRSSECNS